jgi:histidinol-phosphatase
MNEWDAAAVETVVAEAGGRFTDWSGRDRIDAGDGVASNGLLHEAVLARLPAGGGPPRG